MSHKLVNANGHLSLDVYYEVEDAPEQKHWNNKSKWMPTTVHLKLTANRPFGPTLPVESDLTTSSILGETSPIQGITVHGVKINKDGKVGKVPVSDHYYSYVNLPDWIQAIANEMLAELAEGTR
jgi:hypothetical protein